MQRDLRSPLQPVKRNLTCPCGNDLFTSKLSRSVQGYPEKNTGMDNCPNLTAPASCGSEQAFAKLAGRAIDPVLLIIMPGVKPYQVCVAGWYFLPAYYEILAQLSCVYVVAHREHDLLQNYNYCVRQNVGLEWGACHHFLTQVWDGTSAVLFTHDDIEVTCSMDSLRQYIDGLLQSPAEMIGPSYTQFFLMKPRLLQQIRDDGGFWYYSNNHGNVPRNKWAVNRGARAFRRQLRRVGVSFRLQSAEGILEIAIRGKSGTQPQ